MAVGNTANKHAMNKKEAHIFKPCLRHVCFDVLACFVFMKFPNKLRHNIEELDEVLESRLEYFYS